MTKLLIVESPAKAKTISKYLDGEYEVVASVGHVRDLPKSNKKAIDIEAGFVPHYEISKGKEKVIKEIKNLASKASEVILATDPDREGEAIAWHLKELISDKKSDKKKIKRVTYNEITKEAIKDALKEPREIDENLKTAQEARRVLDRLVGYDLSGLIWKKVRYGLSAGRVQSPALRILMEREREIRAFKPEKFWTLTAVFETAKKEELTLTCEEEPRELKEVERIVKIAQEANWDVTQVKETEVKRMPRAPLITSTLQQAASSRLGFTPSRTMGIAQKLYEAGLITYMRTDSTNLSMSAKKQIEQIVKDKYGAKYFQSHIYAKKSKNAQEAHEAIRPTNLLKENAGYNEEQKKLYNLIWARTVSSQMAPANTLRTKVSANVDDGQIPDFAVTGSRILFDGWLLADPRARTEDVELPKVSEKDKMDLKNIENQEKETTPPPRYSEAGLIKELEKRGIGRPSTYASIIKTIIDRGYVEKVDRSLKPTDTGDVVSTFLEENFGDYISDTFTAEMENELDDIALGKREYVRTLKDFYGPFTKEVKSKDKIDKITNLGDADPKWKCPICGGPMIVKLGRSGKFLSCAKFPDCNGARTIDGEEVKADTPIGTDPESRLPIFVRTGRYGPYVQIGEDDKKKKIKAKKASIPKEKNLSEVTVADALVYLSLPRLLGQHPETGKDITASIGRFGPYIVHDGDFRSLKTDDVYTISLERALEILKEPKKKRGFARKKK